MREPGSAWAATVATNPAVVGEVCVRSLAIMLTGGNPGSSVIVPPTLITQSFLNEQDRLDFLDKYKIEITHKDKVTWSTHYPYTGTKDLKSLEYE